MGRKDLARTTPDPERAPERTITRRSFVEVAIGSIFALPVVSGGLVLTMDPKEAYAADATVVVAKCNECAFAVMDVAGNKKSPVKDARVFVKSCFNGKTVEGKTNDKGVAIFDIAPLSEDEGKKKKPERYTFSAEIEVTKDGYRIFRTERVTIEGAKGVALPIRTITKGEAYPSRVTFDDWDILYTNNDFCVTAKNDASHTVHVELEGLSGSGQVKAALYAGDKRIAEGTGNPSGNRCSLDLREQFLLKGAGKVLPEGNNFSLRYEQGGKEFKAPVALKISNARGGYEAPGTDRNFSLSPFTDSKGKGLSITFPSGLPLIGGQTLPMWKPEFDNIDYGFDPFGYAYVSWRTTEWGYKTKDGKVVGNGWQSHPRKTVSEQINKVWEDAGTNALNTMNAIDKRTGKFTHVKLMRTFSTTVGAQLSLAAKWGEKEKDLIRLRAAGQIMLAIDFSLAWQFLAGPVPLVFEFGLNASAVIGLAIAASTPKLTDWNQWKVDYTNSALSLTIDISPSISLGVGIKGALSVSVKGIFTITIYLALTVLPDKRPSYVENPHRVVGLAFQTQVVIQLLFFTIPFNLPLKMKEPQFYDSWKPKNKTASEFEAMAAQAEEDVNFLDIVEDAFESGEGYLLQDEDFVNLAEDEALEINYDDFEDDLGAYNEETGHYALEWKIESRSCEIPGTSESSDTMFVFYDSADAPSASDGGGTDGDLGTGSDKESQTQSQDASQADEKDAVQEAEKSAPQESEGNAATPGGGQTEPGAKDAIPSDGAPTGEGASANAAAPESGSSTDVPAAAAAGAAAGVAATGAEAAGTGSGAGTEGKAASPGASDAASDAVSDTAQQTGAADADQGQPAESGASPEATADTSPAESKDGLAAQSEPQLEPQAWESKGVIAPRLGPSRTYVYDYGAIVKAKVKRTASHAGLVPNAVEVLAKNSFGDPRAQVHLIFGKQYVFRIASVGIFSTEAKQGAQVIPGSKLSHAFRARVICEESGASQRAVWVFDTAPQITTGESKYDKNKRIDYDDYDFDVNVEEKGDKALIRMLIISGHRDARNKDVNNHLAYLLRNQLLTYVVYEFDKSSRKLTVLDQKAHSGDYYWTFNGVKHSVFDATQSSGDENLYHHYSCPCVTLMHDKVGEEEKYGVMLSYLDRAAKDPKKILSQKEGDVKVGAGFYFYSEHFHTGGKYGGIATFPKDNEINSTVFHDLNDHSIYQMTVFPRVKSDEGKGVGWYVVMLKGIYTYYFLYEAGAMAHKEMAYYPGTARQPKLFAVYDRDIEQGSGDLGNFFGPAQLVRWPNHEGFLATVRGKVMHVTLENLVRPSGGAELYRVPEPRFKFTPVGSDNFNVTSFGVDNDGEFIFYPAVREGTPGYRYDKDGKASAKKDVEEHDVMACRLRNGKFSDPFVFCEVDYDMDTLVVCGSQKSVAMAFLSTNLTNAKKSEAEIRFTAMPNTRCANVIGFNAVTDVVFPGIACPFNVTIRNDGNTYLAGCSIRLHRRGKKNNKTDTVTKLTFSKTTLVPSNYNPKKADGTLEDVEPDYALAPGKTSVYTIMLVVPKDWSGKVAASATAQDFVAASMKKVATAADLDLLGVQADMLSTHDEPEDDERADEGYIDMADQYEGIDYDAYDYEPESIEYSDYEEPGPEYSEDGDEYVDYIVEESDYEDDDLLDYPYDEFEVSESDEINGDELSDSYDGEDEEDDAAARRSRIPDTGDPASGMGALGAGLAAAGVAMAAYSRRRVENERAEQEGAEEEE